MATKMDIAEDVSMYQNNQNENDREKEESGTSKSVEKNGDGHLSNEMSDLGLDPDLDSNNEGSDENEESDNETDDENESDDDLFYYFDDYIGEVETKSPPPTATPEKKPEELEKTFFGFQKFLFVPEAHKSHKFEDWYSHPANEGTFSKAFQRDLRLLEGGLPNGIFVKAYEDRMDLLSALIMGPANTPYEGGLFAFDIKLPNNYPHVPPHFYFISFTKTRMNPNLYATCGKVCVSLLGTWKGSHACEKWSKNSSILQVLLSIQALILVPEPYFNEPGFHPNKNDPKKVQASKNYNEMALLFLLHAMAAKLENPPVPWQFEIVFILKSEVPKMLARLESWMATDSASKASTASTSKLSLDAVKVKSDQVVTVRLPDFPLFPIVHSVAFRTAIQILKQRHNAFCAI